MKLFKFNEESFVFKMFCNNNMTGRALFHEQADWCAANLAECNNRKEQYCNGENLDTNIECKNWCASNHGRCDKQMTKYCDSPYNKDKSICSCINSPFNTDPTLIGQTKCIDTLCSIYGYQTTGMLAEGCPPITNCSIIIDAAAKAGVDINNNKFNQQCGSESKEPGNSSLEGAPLGESVKSEEPKMTTSPEPTPLPITVSSVFSSYPMWKIVLIIVFLLFFVGGFGIFMMMIMKSSSGSSGYYQSYQSPRY